MTDARKTVVITGASSGIGRGVAERLAERGTNLVLAARRTRLIETMAERLGDAVAVTADVGDPADMERLLATATARFGAVDVWINNAGAGAVGDFTRIPIEDHLRTIQTTLLGVVTGCHAALRYFEARGRGTIVNVGSTGGYLPFPFYSSYVVAKAGVVALGRVLQLELRERGLDDIHVCTVNPWVTDTPWFEHAANYTGRTLRMPLPNDPRLSIDAIIDLIDRPRDSVDVGPAAKAGGVAESLLPRLTERISAHVVNDYLDDSPTPVPPHSGSLHTPMDAGQGIDGDMRERVRAEDELRRTE